MAQLTICAWAWGQKYGHDYVRKLVDGIRRHLKQPYRFLLISEWVFQIDGIEQTEIPDLDLTKERGCFARLRIFDPEWQKKNDITGRLACFDLDMVITGELDPLFNRPEPFVILRGANAVNPNPLNGSLMMLRAGAYPDVWHDFSLEAAAKTKFHEFPDDQGWIWHKIPDASGWQCGPQSGVFAFRKPSWPKGDDLPADARLVAFPGSRDPSQFTHLQWVKENWI